MIWKKFYDRGGKFYYSIDLMMKERWKETTAREWVVRKKYTAAVLKFYVYYEWFISKISERCSEFIVFISFFVK